MNQKEFGAFEGNVDSFYFLCARFSLDCVACALRTTLLRCAADISFHELPR